MRGVFVIAFGFAILMARMVRVPRATSVVRKRQRAQGVRAPQTIQQQTNKRMN
jgi:hypothetical protein